MEWHVTKITTAADNWTNSGT